MKYISLFFLFFSVVYTQEITFSKVNHLAGEKRVILQSMGLKMNLAVYLKNRRVGQQPYDYRQLLSKEVFILETNNNIPTKVKTVYRNAQVTGANNRMQRLPISGKEYIVALQDNELNTTYRNGKTPYLPQEIQIVKEDHRNLGKINKFSETFSAKTFKVGQKIEMSLDAAKELFGKEADIKTVVCSFKEQKTVNLQECAVVNITAKLSMPFDRFTAEISYSGDMALSLQTAEIMETKLMGPLSIRGETQTPQGTARIEGTGTAGFSIDTKFDGVNALIYRVYHQQHYKARTASTNLSRFLRHRDNVLLTNEDSYSKMFMYHAQSPQAKVREAVALSLGYLPYISEFESIVLQYLQDEDNIILGAVESCARNKELRTEQVKKVLSEIYEKEQKKLKSSNLLKALKKALR
ncbi:hypothetical protein [Candidatus Uabimicrobium sp. HlEnr_7]|uniref:hypothetical protein n=1 Tax=Candidatus Uabimicrobium helgolandensis TaxID=3095367 RepID=UPI00355899EA